MTESDVERIAALRFKLAVRAEAEPGDKFLAWPDRWWGDPHWRCINDHVSTRVLKDEQLGRSSCLECGAPLTLTFPDDVDGPLADLE